MTKYKYGNIYKYWEIQIFKNKYKVESNELICLIVGMHTYRVFYNTHSIEELIVIFNLDFRFFNSTFRLFADYSTESYITHEYDCLWKREPTHNLSKCKCRAYEDSININTQFMEG